MLELARGTFQIYNDMHFVPSRRLCRAIVLKIDNNIDKEVAAQQQLQTWTVDHPPVAKIGPGCNLLQSQNPNEVQNYPWAINSESTQNDFFHEG